MRQGAREQSRANAQRLLGTRCAKLTNCARLTIGPVQGMCMSVGSIFVFVAGLGLAYVNVVPQTCYGCTAITSTTGFASVHRNCGTTMSWYVPAKPRA